MFRYYIKKQEGMLDLGKGKFVLTMVEYKRKKAIKSASFIVKPKTYQTSQILPIDLGIEIPELAFSIIYVTIPKIRKFRVNKKELDKLA